MKAYRYIFSVIIDAHNYGSYIEDAIVSSRKQTFPREYYEIIVVDDGSTDDTRQRVGKYPDVIYHYKENGGQASAFNAGLAIAQGEYIAFLDADDYWAEDKLEKVFNRFEMDASVDVVYHTLHIVDGQNNRCEMVADWFRHIDSKKPIVNNENNFTIFGCVTSGIAWRMQTLERMLPIPSDYRICADGYLMVCGSLVVRKFALIHLPLGFYRLHSGNAFAMLNPIDGTARVKSRELEVWYRKLLLCHLKQLSERINCQHSSMIELESVCFSDELLNLKAKSGTIAAFKALWISRSRFKRLSFKYRCYRILIMILKLLLSPQMYARIQQIYAKSRFWLFVQRCIKNDSNFGTTQCFSRTP